MASKALKPRPDHTNQPDSIEHLESTNLKTLKAYFQSKARAPPFWQGSLADYPAMSFIFVRWQQIKIQMQTSWVGRSTRGSHYQLYYPSDRVLVLFVKVTYYAVQDHIQPCQLYNCATYCHTKNKCRETIGKIFFFNIILLIWFFVLQKIILIGKFLSDIKMINFYFLKSRSLEVVEKGYND